MLGQERRNVGMERVNEELSSLLLEPRDEMLGQGKQNAGNGGLEC